MSKEPVFSDLHHLKVVTTTTRKYETAFGFTEEEVFTALDSYGVSEQKDYVKQWYDGFTFGTTADIYNTWSIINFLDSGEYKLHWANTSSNSLVGKLIRQSGKGIKHKFEDLLRGKSVFSEVDEEIVYSQLEESENAIWSLLLASGYLKVLQVTLPEISTNLKRPVYELTLTNREVEPKNALDDAVILEFKVYNSENEQTLQDTLAAALRQIEEKKYAQGLMIEELRRRGFGSMGLCLKGREC